MTAEPMSEREVEEALEMAAEVGDGILRPQDVVLLARALLALQARLRESEQARKTWERESDAQMQSKLDAQSLLANIAEALAFSREDFDLSDTWRSAAPRIIERLSEIVERAEALEQERDRLQGLMEELSAKPYRAEEIARRAHAPEAEA